MDGKMVHWGAVAAVALIAVTLAPAQGRAADAQLLNVSYDPTREL